MLNLCFGFWLKLYFFLSKDFIFDVNGFWMVLFKFVIWIWFGFVCLFVLFVVINLILLCL